jgi:hypothetical protein
MSHIRIDKSKAIKKWSPVLENMGVTGERVEWMSEYAEFHSINENAYVNASNVSGMGGVISAQPSTLPGQTITGTLALGTSPLTGSGDVGQNLLPVAMKIAAQTIGLDLVAVKPSPGPKIDLLYIDFRYDDNRLGENDERPQVFKLNATNLSDIKTAMLQGTGATIVQSTGGLQNGSWYYSIDTTGVTGLGATISQTLYATASRQDIVEFLGFSRIDGFPMFRAFRQANTSQTVNPGQASGTPLWAFDQTRNTFDSTTAMTTQIAEIANITVTGASVELVSALEDHIPGFSANWKQGGTGFNGNYPMDRDMDDNSYSGVIGPKISSKTVAVGTIEVSSALRRTEIEDIKANTGMDIVQKMESILVNELSQTISKQIVAKIFEMGDLNRTTAPLYTGGATFTGVTSPTIFDLDTSYVTAGGGIGGETTHAVQRKLITKIAHASNYIATEGRVGPAQYLITNGGLAAALQDIAGYTINPLKSKLNASGQLYPVGSIGDISIYVDPYMRYNDNRVVLGRKNNPDQPGIIFVPYLMAQSISIISEATFAPRMLLRSRYAITEVGWFPQKQFMTIRVVDGNQYLN